MHILFIDDTPEYKVNNCISYLLETEIYFTYEICKSVNSALSYIFSHNNIDLIVLDLGLPKTDDSNCFVDYDKYAGLEIIREIYYRRKQIDIPIIINSDTKINFTKEYSTEKEYLIDMYGSNAVIEHVERIDDTNKKWFIDFVYSQIEK